MLILILLKILLSYSLWEYVNEIKWVELKKNIKLIDFK